MTAIDKTIKAVCQKRPFLAEILEAFAPLLKARSELVPELGQLLKSAQVVLPPFKTDNDGRPLLERAELAELAPALEKAAERLLPLLASQPALADYQTLLREFYLSEHSLAPQMLEALLNGDSQTLDKLAAQSQIPANVLSYTGEFISSAVLRALAEQAHTDKGYPWDEEGSWTEGYCPVCGSNPSVAWLDKPQFDENNAFIAGGGGKKHLHCPVCGASWPFRRRTCSFCGESGEESLYILRVEGESAERLECCKKCSTYCPTVDLRELIYQPDMDTLAIGLLHLDLMAAEKELTPLRASFWNTF